MTHAQGPPINQVRHVIGPSVGSVALKLRLVVGGCRWVPNSLQQVFTPGRISPLWGSHIIRRSLQKMVERGL